MSPRVIKVIDFAGEVWYNGSTIEDINMPNKQVRTYLKLADAKEGLVELDTGFTCHVGGKTMLHRNKNGELFFYCDSGKHEIAGQVEDGIHCIGIYPA